MAQTPGHLGSHYPPISLQTPSSLVSVEVGLKSVDLEQDLSLLEFKALELRQLIFNPSAFIKTFWREKLARLGWAFDLCGPLDLRWPGEHHLLPVIQARFH